MITKKIKQKGGGPVYSKKSKLSNAIIAEKPQKAWSYDTLTEKYLPAIANAGVATSINHLPVGVRIKEDGTPYTGGRKRKSKKSNKTFRKTRSKRQRGGAWNELVVASKEGHTETVARLLEHGAVVNAKHNDDNTALYWASRNGHKEIVAMLLDAGADVNAKNEGVVVRVDPHPYMQQPPDGDETALIRASQNGHTEIVAMLLEKGADVNAMDERGMTALIEASWNGHKEIVEMLLAQNGIKVDARQSPYDINALDQARKKGHWEIVVMLLDKGAGSFLNKSHRETLIKTSNQHLYGLPKPSKKVPIMTEEEFATCAKNDEGEVECGITLEELDRFKAVKPLSNPPDNNNVCYDRLALQIWLNTHSTDPITRKNIDQKWIHKWYPLGVELDEKFVLDRIGGKRKTKKSKRKSKKSKRKTRKSKK
jgi:hypothetical protein